MSNYECGVASLAALAKLVAMTCCGLWKLVGSLGYGGPCYVKFRILNNHGFFMELE